MKKVIPFLLLQALFATQVSAQSSIAKVPASASLVVRYSGTSLSKKLPTSKFDTYAILKKELFKGLQVDTKMPLASIGIDEQQDAYQYLTTDDSTACFVSILPIKNIDKFNQFIKTRNKNNTHIEAENGFQSYPISKRVFLGWNGKLVTIVFVDYTKHNYYEAAPTVDTATMFSSVGKETPYSDSSVALEETQSKTDSIAPSMPAGMEERDAPPQVLVDTAAAIVDSTATAAAERQQQIEDSITQAKFDADEKLREEAIQKSVAEHILFTTYDSSVASIQNIDSYNQVTDKNADINVWMNTTLLLNKLYGGLYGIYHFNLTDWPGYVQGLNVYFDNDKVRIEQKMYADDSTLQVFKGIFNNKQDPSLLNYLRPSDIGYMSMSMNTEAMINFYYGAAKKLLSGYPNLSKYSELINTYIDFLQIIIDEKAIADMIPGNALFILHGLEPKKVKYISYDYDKDFNATQTEKTKIEASPNFTVVFETRNEKIFNEFANLPVKLGKEEHFDYTKTGDYYTLDLGNDGLISDLYFKVKDGKCIITTSLQDVADVMPNMRIDAATQQSILNNNYSADIDVNALVTSLSGQAESKESIKMMQYLKANAGSFNFESSFKNGSVQTNYSLTTRGKHQNSLQYLFDLIEGLMEISEKK